MMKIATMTLFPLMIACLICAVQERKTHEGPPGRVRLSDLHWIAGIWRTKAGDEVLLESWNEPLGNQMLGMFHWVKDGKPLLCEFLSLTQADEAIVLRLRHFDPDMRALEDEPLHLPLISVKPGEAVFENAAHDYRVTYIQTAKDALVARVEDLGKSIKKEFAYSRE